MILISVSLSACFARETEMVDNDDVEEIYEVVKVVDGDTIDVDIKGKIERVRLLGIDTPESVDPRSEVECFGIEASERMKSLVEGEKVRIEEDASQSNRDKYNRLLRYVYLVDGIFVNELLVREGYADRFYSNPRCEKSEIFKEALEFAKKNKVGLWAEGACD